MNLFEFSKFFTNVFQKIHGIEKQRVSAVPDPTRVGLKWVHLRCSLLHLNLLDPVGFEVRKKSLERYFYEKISSRAGSKHGPCLINSITNIFVVLDLIMLQNGNNLLKMNNRFGADL